MPGRDRPAQGASVTPQLRRFRACGDPEAGRDQSAAPDPSRDLHAIAGVSPGSAIFVAPHKHQGGPAMNHTQRRATTCSEEPLLACVRGEQLVMPSRGGNWVVATDVAFDLAVASNVVIAAATHSATVAFVQAPLADMIARTLYQAALALSVTETSEEVVGDLNLAAILISEAGSDAATPADPCPPGTGGLRIRPAYNAVID